MARDGSLTRGPGDQGWEDSKMVDKKVLAGLKDNAGMITLYRHNADHTVSIVLTTYRVDSVANAMRRKSPSRYSVAQAVR